jgi:parvulin-like peptidyl-prolyl isomerase
MVSIRRALAAAACAAAVLSACKDNGAEVAGESGGGNPAAVVATVGGRPVTLGYFEQRLAKMERRFLPDTLDARGKRKFLDFIINKELMALRAEELKYGESPMVVNNLKILEENLIINTAIDEVTKGKLEPTAADLEEFETKKKQKAMVKQLAVPTRAQADAVRAKLQAGADFDAVAREVSILPKVTPKGDSIPEPMRVNMEVAFGDAMIPVEEAVFATPVGQVSEPVQTGYGWQLFMPVSIKEIARPPVDEEGRRRNGVQIQLRRKRRLVEDYYESILKEHKFSIDEDAIVLLYDKLPQDLPPEQAPDPATEQKPILALSHDDRARFLFEVDGQRHTVGDFSDKYDQTNWFERPKRITGFVGIRYWIRDRWLRPLQLERARRNGIQNLPAVADEVRMRREQMMVSLLHQNLISGQAPVPIDQQLEEFYEQHKDLYVDKERRRCNFIVNTQERVVRRAAEEIKGGKDFVEVAIAYNENASSPEQVKSPEFTADAEDFKEVAPVAFGLQKVGDYSEPFKVSTNWVMLQLDAVIPSRQIPLQEILEDVATDWQNQWREDKLNELLVDWKAQVPIQVNEKVLAQATVTREDVFVPGRAATPPSSN